MKVQLFRKKTTETCKEELIYDFDGITAKFKNVLKFKAMYDEMHEEETVIKIEITSSEAKQIEQMQLEILNNIIY